MLTHKWCKGKQSHLSLWLACKNECRSIHSWNGQHCVYRLKSLGARDLASTRWQQKLHASVLCEYCDLFLSQDSLGCTGDWASARLFALVICSCAL